MNFPLPIMDPCYFCTIIEGQLEQWNIIEQTDLTVTLLNGRQFEVGQCMVLPLRHAPTLLDLTEPEEAAVMAAARRLTQAMITEFSPEGVLLYQNNGVGSGQEVPHFHLHVVPRSPGSDWGTGPPHIAKLENKQEKIDHTIVTRNKRQTAERLRKHFN